MNDRDWPVVLVLGVGLFISFLGWKVKTAIGVDFTAGLYFVCGVAVALAVFLFAWWQGIAAMAVVPLNLAIVWIGFWPALEQLGVKKPLYVGLTAINMDQNSVELYWWAEWYSELLVLAVILGVGYYLVLGRRY
ncbi:hypothetical protein VQ065_31680 [Pseudomonas sp. KBN10P06128]|uniref:hypothetical protein n=1 Tax=Pseudomonas sp. KBN10P06128 TaxID=3113719 RepID=UPI0030A8120F|nr:hypothetical protein [Pseudomonas aeruginosa]